MGANDHEAHPWILSESDLLRECLERGHPVVGICLGGQILAKALGGHVQKHHTLELGWHSIRVNHTGMRDPVLWAAGPNPRVHQWHGNTFFLPPGAELLASSDACERKAYRFGEKAYGLQFHPEVDQDLLQTWLASEAAEREVQEALERFGARYVQECPAQRIQSKQWEKCSLQIIAAIASLFRFSELFTGPTASLSRMNSLRKARAIQLEVGKPPGGKLQLNGEIVHRFSIEAGEFLLLREQNGPLWPIRLDDISDFQLK